MIRTDIDHVQIMDVVHWSRFDKSNGVATIMMSTVNLKLLEQVRINDIINYLYLEIPKKKKKTLTNLPLP